MLEVLTWWVLLELIGLAVWPVAFRFLKHLPDRGYAFCKPLGLVLIAYPYWLLATLGFLDNTRGAVVLTALIVGALSWWLGTRKQTPLGPSHPIGIPKADSETSAVEVDGPITGSIEFESPFVWLNEHARLVLATELVFTVAFFGWAWVRAYMPEITATEKPMEFAFLNGILQSNHFPPIDPWLSGYAISYYYFGYLMVAMLTLASGVASSVAFNLAIALLYALAAIGAFGLVYDLIRAFENRMSSSQHRGSPSATPLLFSLFAPVLLLVSGNLEGVFEAIHARGLASPGFWQWLDVKGLMEAPITNTFVPTDNWWWWRASRVIHDVAAGQTQEVIDEFPQFSFLLGDMHPHVLALPFALLALAAALNVMHGNGILNWNVRISGRNLRLIDPLLALIIGALGFLNSWDMPTYGFVVVAAYALSRAWSEGRWDRQALQDIGTCAIALVAAAILLYLPFYVGFQSQAGGILPVLLVKTKLHQYLIMFGMFVVILVVFISLVVRERRISLPSLIRLAAPFLLAIVAFPLLVAAFATLLLAISPAMQESARAAFPGSSDGWLVNVIGAYFGPFLSNPWLFVLLALVLGAILGILRFWPDGRRHEDPETAFALLLAFTGFLLTFGVEFVFLRDNFGTRMNSVFKFYFQTWTLFSIAAGYAIYRIARGLAGAARTIWIGALSLLLLSSFIYPAMAIPNRADDFTKAPTLDGIQWIREFSPGDYAAIRWLNANAPRGSTIVEATGGEYSYGNRISMATGIPTVLGWAGHELQWRGNSRLFKDDAEGIDRASDISRIYQTLDSKESLTLLDKYAISFVVVGQTERSQYGMNRSQVDKFGQILKLVFESGDVRIYARTS